MQQSPTFAHELKLWQQGYQHVAGVDEVGRGALAGPVVAGAVILPPHAELAGIWTQVRDSKQLTATARVALAPQIMAAAVAWAVGSTSAEEIDRIGIAAGTRQAMVQAIIQLHPQPDHLLIDWVRLPQINIAQSSFIKADQQSVTVAAASILAKVYRDQVLIDLADEYPSYGFAQHKGYGTRAHLAALTAHGPCLIHRHSFAPLAQSPTLFTER